MTYNPGTESNAHFSSMDSMSVAASSGHVSNQPGKMRPELFNVRNAPFIESLTHPLAQPGDGLRIRNRFPSKSYSASHNAFPFADSPFRDRYVLPSGIRRRRRRRGLFGLPFFDVALPAGTPARMPAPNVGQERFWFSFRIVPETTYFTSTYGHFSCLPSFS